MQVVDEVRGELGGARALFGGAPGDHIIDVVDIMHEREIPPGPAKARTNVSNTIMARVWPMWQGS